MALYDGIICPSPVAIERIVFYAADGNIDGKNLTIWQYDERNTNPLLDGDGLLDDTLKGNYLLTENGSEVP